jgi:hypothetical protein
MTIKTTNAMKSRKQNGKETNDNENQQFDKKILYTILNECAQYTLDPYWKQIFEDCSRGKFPRGCSIDNDGKILYIKKPTGINQQYQTYVLNKPPGEIFIELKKIFQEQLNLKSNRDRQIQRDEFDDICKDLQESFTSGWQKIKRKKIKDPIIRRYILELKDVYNLDDRETAEVAQILKLGFLFNWIDNDDVVYEDQRIIEIKTLHFDPEERTFELDEPSISLKREYKPKISKLSSLWEKHLEQPKNRYII